MGLAIVLLYIALNLLSPAEMFPDIAPFRPLLILAIASLPLSLIERVQSPEIGKLRTQMVLVLLFFGFAVCSWLPHGWLGGGLMALLDVSPNIIVYFVGVVQFRTPARLRILRTTLIVVTIFVLMFAFSEVPLARATGTSTPYVMSQVSLDQTQVRIRGLGMIHDPNVFGQLLLMLLPFLYVAKKDNGLGIGYLLAVPITVLFIVGVIYTDSRGAETGLAVLIGLALTQRFGKTGLMASGLLGGIAVAIINFTRDRSVTVSGGMDRLAIWSEGLQYFKQHPLYGVGFNEFIELNVMTAHNSYLLVAAELGIIGFFLWMSMIVVTMIQLNRVPKVVGESNPGLARWAVALKLSMGVYLYTSFFLSRAYDMPLFLLLGMSGGVIAAAGGDETIPLRGTMWPVKSLAICGGLLTLIYAMLRLRLA